MQENSVSSAVDVVHDTQTRLMDQMSDQRRDLLILVREAPTQEYSDYAQRMLDKHDQLERDLQEFAEGTALALMLMARKLNEVIAIAADAFQNGFDQGVESGVDEEKVKAYDSGHLDGIVAGLKQAEKALHGLTPEQAGQWMAEAQEALNAWESAYAQRSA